MVAKSLSGFDCVIVTGAPGSRKLLAGATFLKWIGTAKGSKLLASVRTGALLLGAAGFLKGRRATTHHNAYELLQKYCSTVVKDARIVDEGDVITAGGVSASIDLGPYLCKSMRARKLPRKFENKWSTFHS